MFFVWLSEHTVTFAFYIISRLVFITEVDSVYCAVRTEPLYKTDTPRSYRAKNAGVEIHNTAQCGEVLIYKSLKCIHDLHSTDPGYKRLILSIRISKLLSHCVQNLLNNLTAFCRRKYHGLLCLVYTSSRK
jgi:hypothetical protein